MRVVGVPDVLGQGFPPFGLTIPRGNVRTSLLRSFPRYHLFQNLHQLYQYHRWQACDGTGFGTTCGTFR